MKPIAYEIRRTFTGKFAIVMMITIIGLSALLAYETASTATSPPIPNEPSVSLGYYINNDTINIIGFVHNAYGNPLRGINVYYRYNSTSYHLVSSSTGYANVTVPRVNSSTLTINVNYTYRQFGNIISVTGQPYVIKTSIPYSGLEIFEGIINPSNSSDLGFMVFYVGANGSSSPPMNLTLEAGNFSSQTHSGNTNPSFIYYYNLTSVKILKIYPQLNSRDINMSFVLIASVGGNHFQYFLYKLSNYIPITQSKLQSLIFSGGSSILGLFIPILAIFIGYLTYGKDRTSGVLESVLKRPVTRGQLISTRFLSNALAIFVAGSVAMIITDLIYYHYLHLYLTGSFVLTLIWTYLVEGVAFLSLIYMISHLARSQGALLGAVIGVFIVFDLFWSVIAIAVMSALGISSNSSSYVTINMLFDYVSPAGYSNLIETLITGKLGVIGGISINPSAYGINMPILFIAGLIWMIAPFSIAYFIAKYRD